tara:strand:- start:36 stop:164 length:129 start_codon:yes stop_codon:yes gene_type:complete
MWLFQAILQLSKNIDDEDIPDITNEDFKVKPISFQIYERFFF